MRVPLPGHCNRIKLHITSHPLTINDARNSQKGLNVNIASDFKEANRGGVEIYPFSLCLHILTNNL